ncbi:glycosyltransferase [Salinimicrobium marinum]|nr:glycosyltransferase [Salinimicrobium marinum]
MEENQIAVVIPFFKKDFFDKTLESLSIQTNKRFTVYVGNDASPDDPLEIIGRYSNMIKIRYTNFDQNLGANSLSKQWQRCLNQVDIEEWVIILGDDDVLGMNCIAEFYTHLTNINMEAIDVIRFASLVIDSQGKAISEVQRHPVIENSIRFLFRKINGNARSSISEHIFKISSVRKYKFKDLPLAWHTDDLALLEFSNFGNIFSINAAVVYIRLSKISISGRNDLSRLKNTSSFLFYNYLLKNYSTRFSKMEKRVLLKKMEKRVLDDKANFILFSKLALLYFRKYDMPGFALFLLDFSRNIRNSYHSRLKGYKGKMK